MSLRDTPAAIGNAMLQLVLDCSRAWNRVGQGSEANRHAAGGRVNLHEQDGTLKAVRPAYWRAASRVQLLLYPSQ